MKIEFDENGIFELEINCSSSLIFTKKDDGCISIKMPKFYNETTQELSKGLVYHVLTISGTDEQFEEQYEKLMQKQNPS
jgi:hypothetical protein